MSGIGEKYECEICHGVFTKIRSDEEAAAEMRETWVPTSGDDDPGVVCDDCFQEVLAWATQDAPEVLREGARGLT
jgi:hypothetical protein